jgi:NAD(P)-dependent dehydrogenase (short-subunit alcohol dehydrogenase family)
MADGGVTKQREVSMDDHRPVVLITGCSTGIGRASAEYCAVRGWYVIATARRIEAIRDLAGGNIALLPLDVADEASRVRAVEEALARTGRIDALVNNAGYSQAGPLAEVTLDEMRVQFETNVFGAFRLAQLVIPAMRKQGTGRIINVSSIVGRVTFPFGGLYCGTKHAMESLSDSLRLELKPWRIPVIVIEPGGVHTQFADTAARFLARLDRKSTRLNSSHRLTSRMPSSA